MPTLIKKPTIINLDNPPAAAAGQPIGNSLGFLKDPAIQELIKLFGQMMQQKAQEKKQKEQAYLNTIEGYANAVEGQRGLF